MHRRNICVRCGECVSNCSREALSLSTKQLSIYRKKCNLCGQCAQKCPTGALAVVGKEMNTKEVMEEVNKDLAFYDESGGGITISGGEPLMQINFLNELLHECKKEHIHTAVDTSGYAPWGAIEKIKDKVDIFLYDIKIMDNRKHRKFTGVSNKQILANVRRLAENGSNLMVRFAVISEINDDEDNVTTTAKFIVSCGIERICLLPYHRAGIEKYRNLGRGYRLETTKPPQDQKLSLIKEQLEAFGLAVTIGGG